MKSATVRLMALGALLAACSSAPKSDGTSHLCMSNAYVFCLCADGSHGTKQCSEDGQSFGVCGECSGDGPSSGGSGGRSDVGGSAGSSGKGGGGSSSTGGGGSSSTGGGGSGSTGGGGGSGSIGGGGSGSTGGGGSAGGGGSGSTGGGGSSSGGGSGGKASGGVGGKGGAGGSVAVAGDKCPGVAIALTPATDPLLPGSTVGAQDDYAAPCAKSAGGEVVYAITASAAGTITVKAQAQAPLVPALTAWTGVCGQGAPTGCSDGASAGGVTTLDVPVAAGATVYVAVDSDGAAGAFALALHLAPAAVCGDGKAQAPEQCDDGNVKDGDGCAHDCTVEANPAFVDCPGLVFHVWGPASVVSGSTASYMNYDQGTCGGSTAKDRFYQLVPELAGTLHATITTASFDAVLYARTGDCVTGTEVACNDTIGKGGDHVDVPVVAGAPLWLAVDGYSTQSGTFTLSVSID